MEGSLNNRHRLRQHSVMYSDVSSYMQSGGESSSESYYSKSNKFSDPLASRLQVVKRGVKHKSSHSSRHLNQSRSGSIVSVPSIMKLFPNSSDKMSELRRGSVSGFSKLSF